MLDSLVLTVIFFGILWGPLSAWQHWELPVLPQIVSEQTVQQAFATTHRGSQQVFPYLLVLWVAYDVLMNGTFGATLGKMAIGARIIGADGSRLSYSRALLRSLAGRLTEMLLYWVTSGCGATRQTRHARFHRGNEGRLSAMNSTPFGAYLGRGDGFRARSIHQEPGAAISRADPGKIVIDGFFKLVHWLNTGAAWSLFRDQNDALAVVSGVALICLILWRRHFHIQTLLGQLSLALIWGGIAGNLSTVSTPPAVM